MPPKKKSSLKSLLERSDWRKPYDIKDVPVQEDRFGANVRDLTTEVRSFTTPLEEEDVRSFKDEMLQAFMSLEEQGINIKDEKEFEDAFMLFTKLSRMISSAKKEPEYVELFNDGPLTLSDKEVYEKFIERAAKLTIPSDDE